MNPDAPHRARGFPDACTGLYGILGHPVRHSLSPAMHNAAFQARAVNAVYLAFDVTNLGAAVTGMRALGISGLSVTIPHKENIVSLLDDVDPVARRIGAVNTVVNRNGRLEGANTDCVGSVRALEEVTELRGRKVLVLGAGGSARAVVAGLVDRGAQVHVANRTPERAHQLGEALGAEWSGLDEIGDVDASILVNTTSVGMEPEVGASPVASELLGRFEVVMDLVYAPLETRLLSSARKRGCRVVNGLRMLLHQAVAQYELWRWEAAPVDVMERALMNQVRGRNFCSAL